MNSSNGAAGNGVCISIAFAAKALNEKKNDEVTAKCPLEYFSRQCSRV
jgi:hypothetical protein